MQSGLRQRTAENDCSCRNEFRFDHKRIEGVCFVFAARFSAILGSNGTYAHSPAAPLISNLSFSKALMFVGGPRGSATELYHTQSVPLPFSMESGFSRALAKGIIQVHD